MCFESCDEKPLKFIRKFVLVLLSVAVMFSMMPLFNSVYAADKVISVSLDKTSMSLKAGNGEGITVTYTYSSERNNPFTPKWTSSDKSVATVSQGWVTAKSKGSCVITCTVGDKSAKCSVTVKGSGSSGSVDVSDIQGWINDYRTDVGAKRCKRTTKLDKVAKTRAKELSKKFSYKRPNGKKGSSLIKGNVYKGELIAKGQTSCEEVCKDWHKKKSNRKVMLKKKFKKMGIASYKKNGTIYWVVVFSS